MRHHPAQRNVRTATLCLVFIAVLAVPVAFGNPAVFTDWSKGTGKVPGLWQGLQVANPDRFRQTLDPHVPHKGSHSTVIRVEVRPGDNVNSSHGERAEVSGMQNAKGQALPVTLSSGHEFYGISVKLDPKWQAPDANSSGYAWGTFFQLHGPDNLQASPSFAIMAERDFHLDICGGDLSDGGKRDHPRGPASYPLTDGSLSLGQWVQFLLDVVWKADNTGISRDLSARRRQNGMGQSSRKDRYRDAPVYERPACG